MSEVRYRRLPQHEEDGNGTSIYWYMWFSLFLSDPGIPGVRSMGPVSNWVSEGRCWNYTSYRRCTSYTSYRLYTSYTSYRLYTSFRLYTEKVTVLSGAIWWTNLELMQVVPSSGQIWKNRYLSSTAAGGKLEDLSTWRIFFAIKNIARIANAVQWHSLLPKDTS